MRTKAVRLKYICRLGYGDALPKDEESAGDIPVFGSNGQYVTTSKSNTKAPVIVIGRKGSYGKLNWSQTNTFASDTTFFVDARFTKSNLRWLYWAMQTLRLDEGSQEAAVPGLNREWVYEQRVVLPDLSEQTLIANYLDRETAHIDALIVEKERMLALLQEKHAAFISQSVTRGLNPDVPLKPSGLDWLGDIPVHWNVRRCAALFQEVNERGKPDLPLLNVSLNTGVTLRVFSDDRIESVAADFATYKIARRNDLVFNKMRFWQGAAGIAPADGLTSPDYTVASMSNELLPEYIEKLVRIRTFSNEVRRYSYGMVDDRLRLYWDGFKNIRIPVPPMNEQENIVSWIDTEEGEIEKVSNLLKQSIDLLKERRAALITAAVTGQIPLEEMAA